MSSSKGVFDRVSVKHFLVSGPSHAVPRAVPAHGLLTSVFPIAAVRTTCRRLNRAAHAWDPSSPFLAEDAAAERRAGVRT